MKSAPVLKRQRYKDAIIYFKTIGPLLFLIPITFFFGEFVISAIEANLAINLGIILVGLYAATLIILRLAEAHQDFKVVERFGQEATNGVDMKDLLEQPWIQTRYVRHYLSHIANTGGKMSSQMDQSAIENELHALQKEYDNKLELPQFFIGFMIAMGLLGTFIGLLETLTGISGMLDGMGGVSAENIDKEFMKLVVELRRPLAGMGIAFSASMFGLIGSIVLSMMMISLRRYIGSVVSLSRNVMHSLIDVSFNNQVNATSSYDDRPAPALSSGVSATMLVGKFDLLAKKIETIVDAIQSSTASTQRLVDLLGFGPRMRELSEKNLEELKLLTSKSGDSQKTLQRLVDVGNENLKITGSVFENVNRNVDDMLDYQKQTGQIVTSSLSNMSDNLQKMEETNLGSARHLWEIKEKLSKLSETSTMVELMASGVSSQTVLLEALIEEIRTLKRTSSN
jgi:biopolymer transport protein ExbB/TolQ